MKKLLVTVLFTLLCFQSIEGTVNCNDLKKQLNNQITIFIDHALTTSVSDNFNVCRDSVTLQGYLNMLDGYKILVNSLDPTTNTSCLVKFVNQDRLNMFQSVYEQANRIWDEAFCVNCYTDWNSDVSANHTWSDATINFFHQVDALDVCIKNYTKKTHSSSACTNCQKEYVHLNEIYEEIATYFGKEKICFDIENKMNKTRRLWSGDMGCCRDKKSPILKFILSTITVAIVTIGFYVFMFIRTKQIEMRDSFPVSNEESGRSALSINADQPGTSIIAEPPTTNIINPKRITEKPAKEVIQKKKITNIDLAKERDNLINLNNTAAPQPSTEDVPPLL